MKRQFFALGSVVALAGCFGSALPSSSTSIIPSSTVVSSIISTTTSVISTTSVSSSLSTPVSSLASTSLVTPIPYSELMALAMGQLLSSTKFEAGLSFHLRTEEMEVLLNPLLRIQRYKDDDFDLLHVHYFNKILEGLGIHSLDLYADFENQMIYHHDTQVWGGETMEDVLNFTGLINLVQAGEFLDFDFILSALEAELTDFETIDYLGAEDVLGVTADHYRIHYDWMDTLETIFNYLNANEALPEIDFIDFNDFLTQTGMSPVVPLLQNIAIEAYLNATTDEVVRIGMDLAVTLQTVISLFEDEITMMLIEQFPEIDVAILASYIEKLEVGINFWQIDALPVIVIPQEALDSYVPYVPETVMG